MGKGVKHTQPVQRRTTKKEASLAAKVLADPRSSARDKSLAGSVLSQAAPKQYPKRKRSK